MRTGRTDMGVYPSTHKTLLERLQSGDDVSWREFYDRYSSVVLRLAAAHGIPEGECQDLLQNVMIKFFRNGLILKYDAARARFRTYFNQVLFSCITDFRRQKQQAPCDPREEEPQQLFVPPASEELFAEEWRAQMLQEALDRLRLRMKPRNFLAFHLTVFRKKKASEVAKFLDTDVDSVYVAKSRGTALLRQIVSELKSEDPELNLVWSE